MTTPSASAPAARLPGLAVCLALGGAAMGLAALVRPWAPALSPLLLAILAGVAWRNLAPVPGRLSPGIAFAAKPVLRAGIVLLGLQLALGDVLALGWGVIGLVVAAVGVTFAATLALGRALRLPWDLTALVASGFSICGAAAQRRRDSRRASPPDDGAAASSSRPPLVPWFVVGFLTAMLLRSTGLLPDGFLDVAAVVQQLLLATAMAVLGLGVHLRSIVQVGPRPLVLGAASTGVAVAVGGAGAWLLGPGLSLG